MSKTYKVAYNTCYGGFGLSKKAELLYRSLKSMPDEDAFFADELDRHDPVLIAVIEKLGKEANGFLSNLAIRTINSSKYRIAEYDGIEQVITPEDEKYILIEE